MINAIDNKYIEIAVIQEAIIMKPTKIKNKRKR